MGVWTTVDILDAMKYGYKAVEVFELWDWGYEEPTTTIFEQFVNSVIKRKVESSGCTPELAEEWAQEWLEREGIDIDVNKVTNPKNDAMYTTCKIMANSLWYITRVSNLPICNRKSRYRGKMSELQHLRKTEFFLEWPSFAKLLQDTSKQLDDLQLVGKDVMMASYHQQGEDEPTSPFQNVFISSLVTAYARRQLNLKSQLKLSLFVISWRNCKCFCCLGKLT